MSDKEKLAMLEDIMELDENTLSVDDVLEDYDEWDSITALSLISLLDEQFGKTISGEEIRAFKTVSDVLKVMK